MKSLYSYKIHILIFLLQALILYINIFIFHKRKNNIFLIIAIINNIFLSLLGFYNNLISFNVYYFVTKFLFIVSIINFIVSFYFNFLKKFIEKKKYKILYKNMICPCCILQLLIQPFGLFLNNTILLMILFIQMLLLVFLIKKKNSNITLYISLVINVIYFINVNYLYVYANLFFVIKCFLLISTILNITLGIYSMYIKNKNKNKNNDKCCKH
jgi:hypothetical protein